MKRVLLGIFAGAVTAQGRGLGAAVPEREGRAGESARVSAAFLPLRDGRPSTLRGLPLFLAICLLGAMPLLYRPASWAALVALGVLWFATPAWGSRRSRVGATVSGLPPTRALARPRRRPGLGQAPCDCLAVWGSDPASPETVGARRSRRSVR